MQQKERNAGTRMITTGLGILIATISIWTFLIGPLEDRVNELARQLEASRVRFRTHETLNAERHGFLEAYKEQVYRLEERVHELEKEK